MKDCSQSTATVKTIHLTKAEADEARKAKIGENRIARKDKEDKTRLARQAVVRDAEENATQFASNFAKLHALNSQYTTMYHSFREIADANIEPLKVVRHFFAHKKDGELLFGEFSTGEAWSQARCNVGFDYVCRCLNPIKAVPLLKAANDSNETAQSSVSSKPTKHAIALDSLLKNSTTKTVRKQIITKFDKEIADAKKANDAETQAALAKQASEMESANAKHIAKIKADAAQQLRDELATAARKEKQAVSLAVDETASQVLQQAEAKIPKKETTALEANALDEAILILRGIVFTIEKSKFNEKKYFAQAVEFLKAHKAFSAPQV